MIIGRWLLLKIVGKNRKKAITIIKKILMALKKRCGKSELI
jgi:hypothetical protein